MLIIFKVSILGEKVVIMILVLSLNWVCKLLFEKFVSIY